MVRRGAMADPYVDAVRMAGRISRGPAELLGRGR